MANASKHHIGAGSQGKGAGTGGTTNLQEELLGDNEVLSNRDKASHGDEVGLDSKAVLVQQYQASAASHETEAEGAGKATSSTSELARPMSDGSSESSTKRSISSE